MGDGGGGRPVEVVFQGFTSFVHHERDFKDDGIEIKRQHITMLLAGFEFEK